LFTAGRVHVAITVPGVNVLFVQSIKPGAIDGINFTDIEVPIFLDDALEASAGFEFIDQNAAGDAATALRTVGAIDVRAAATKANFSESGMKFSFDFKLRIDEKCLCFFPGQITAVVGDGGIESEIFQGRHTFTRADELLLALKFIACHAFVQINLPVCFDNTVRQIALEGCSADFPGAKAC